MDCRNQLELFQKATRFYHQRDFGECLELLNLSLKERKSTMGYNNRAIAHYRLGHLTEAAEDLELSVEMDHLNFIAYFNLFSLHSLREETKQALTSLALGVSSLHTVKCRQTPNAKNASRALQLSFNNKQAMMMQGLIYLQQSQYHKSLKMIQQAYFQQNSQQNRKDMLAIVKYVAKLAREESTGWEIKNVGGQTYQLKTTLASSQKQQYPSIIADLLKEFNLLYWSLTEEEDQAQPQGVHPHSSLIDSASLCHREDQPFTSQKQDQQANHATTHNSSLCLADPQASILSQARSKQSSSLFLQPKEGMEANTQNTILDQSSISEAILSKQEDPKSQSISINFIIYYAQIESITKNAQLYAVLQYDPTNNNVFRSSLSKKENQCFSWNELSSDFALTAQPSTLSLKVYNKEYSRFRDELVGEAVLAIGQLGVASLPLLDRRSRQTGTIMLGVTLKQ